MAPELKPFRDALIQVWVSWGEPLTEDIYSGHMHGLTHCVDSIYKGERQGSYLYLQSKPNVTVMSPAYSKRLIIDPASRLCSGVEVMDAVTGAETSVYAAREVIVSRAYSKRPSS